MARMNQRDQAHAYRFLSRRLTSALVREDPDGPDAPMRRLAIASFGSVMVAALCVAGAGVLGVLSPGGATAWKNGQAVILEQQTGTRYLYTAGALHPVLNYASARLALGKADFSMVSVSPASLRGVPRGVPVGIPGAPDELPTPATLASWPWSACSLPAQDQAGAASAYVRLSVGRPPAGSVLPGGRGILVSAADGTVYLIWNGARLRIPGGPAALAALGYASQPPLLVGDAWLTVLPQGPDLAAPQVPDLGTSGPVVAGRAARVGQVFVASGNGQAAGGPPQYYLALRGGLLPMTVTAADLMLADPAARRLYPAGRPAAIVVTAAAIATVPALPAAPAALPGRPPPLLAADGPRAVCAVYQAAGSATPQVRSYALAASAVQVRQRAAPTGLLGIPLADQVLIAGGDGAVAQAVAAPGDRGGTVYLITSQGIKYPLTSASLLTSLGLAGVRPAPVPAVLLGLLRSGPTLDPRAAMRASQP